MANFVSCAFYQSNKKESCRGKKVQCPLENSVTALARCHTCGHMQSLINGVVFPVVLGIQGANGSQLSPFIPTDAPESFSLPNSTTLFSVG